MRKPLKSSLRWSVFYRDGFACRYCGAQAGQDDVELAVDHVVSVADGGDNSYDNLVTACRSCNGGKGARSLQNLPHSDDIIARIKARREAIVGLGDELQSASDASEALRQEIVNLKCRAYRVEVVALERSEINIAKRLLAEFGADKVVQWYETAYAYFVPEKRAIKYVCGCARKTREAAL